MKELATENFFVKDITQSIKDVLILAIQSDAEERAVLVQCLREEADKQEKDGSVAKFENQTRPL